MSPLVVRSIAINCTQLDRRNAPANPRKSRTDGVAERSHHVSDPFRCKCRCAALWASVGAPHAPEGQPDALGPTGSGDLVGHERDGLRPGGGRGLLDNEQ
jgi:hypothetical protein